MSKRATRAQIAQETMTVLKAGTYHRPDGQPVVIRDELAAARTGSRLYTPEQLAELHRRRDTVLRELPSQATAVEAVNETTLSAARRLLDAEPAARVLALNFASARHPGGGFLNGSQAQEESLARASGLYPCIAQFGAMYAANTRFPSCLYTDHLIYSPDVPVFRDDDDGLLERPYWVSFVTAPAVNAGAVRRNEPKRLAQVEPVMLARMEHVLSVAVVHGHEVLVLGAWGCGVFGNDPACVAAWFHQHLTGAGIFRTAFRRVVFAVLDRTTTRSTIAPFERLFGGSRSDV